MTVYSMLITPSGFYLNMKKIIKTYQAMERPVMRVEHKIDHQGQVLVSLGKPLDVSVVAIRTLAIKANKLYW